MASNLGESCLERKKRTLRYSRYGSKLSITINFFILLFGKLSSARVSWPGPVQYIRGSIKWDNSDEVPGNASITTFPSDPSGTNAWAICVAVFGLRMETRW
jgi:hypothetical protein